MKRHLNVMRLYVLHVEVNYVFFYNTVVSTQLLSYLCQFKWLWIESINVAAEAQNNINNMLFTKYVNITTKVIYFSY